uniref:UNC93-like protein MFSD11 n=1 Tax=Globodera pallida TaxID=36090 RepID=A0A183BYV0_GLOPA
MDNDDSDEIVDQHRNQSNNRRECSTILSCCSSSTRNVLQLGIGFFFIFFAFNSQGFIEESVLDSFARKSIGVKFHDGYTSLATIYASFTVLNFVATPIVASLGARWALVFAGLTYAVFQAGFLFINRWYLFSSSALLGLGAAANHTSISVATVRLIYSTFTALTVVGIVILALLKMPSTAAAAQNRSSTTNTTRCRRRSPSLAESTDLEQTVDGTEAGQAAAEAAVQQQQSHLAILSSTFQLMATRRMAIFSFAFMYSGISQSFWSAIYPTTVANTEMFQMNQGVNPKLLLALTAIVQGVGQATSGFIFGILDNRTRHFGRSRIVAFGAVLQLISFLLAYLNLPAHAPLEKTFEHGILNSPSITLALVGGFLLSFGDACWNTQIFATLIAKYPIRTTQAFAVFKFFQSLLCCAAFFYATSLSLPWHVLILVIGLLIGVGAFLIAEQLPRQPDDDLGGKVNLAKPDFQRMFAVLVGYSPGAQLIRMETSRYFVAKFHAFAVFKFFQSLLCCAAFFYATSLSLPWHVLILVIGLLIGVVAFLIAEQLPRQTDDDLGAVAIPTHFEDDDA